MVSSVAAGAWDVERLLLGQLRKCFQMTFNGKLPLNRQS